MIHAPGEGQVGMVGGLLSSVFFSKCVLRNSKYRISEIGISKYRFSEFGISKFRFSDDGISNFRFPQISFSVFKQSMKKHHFHSGFNVGIALEFKKKRALRAHKTLPCDVWKRARD